MSAKQQAFLNFIDEQELNWDAKNSGIQHPNSALRKLIKEKRAGNLENGFVIYKISKALNKRSQDSFVAFTKDGAPGDSIVLDAGDGKIAKIIPLSATDNIPDILSRGAGTAPLLLPSFARDELKGSKNCEDFKIKYYPHLGGAVVNANEIAQYKENIAQFGLSVKSGFDNPENFRKLPDKNKTIVGIDSNMLQVSDANKFKSAATKKATQGWLEHMEKVFPNAYNLDQDRMGGVVRAQRTTTEFGVSMSPTPSAKEAVYKPGAGFNLLPKGAFASPGFGSI